MMSPDDDMFNSETKESDMFSATTKSTPHKLNLYYCLDLPSNIIGRFPTETIRKRVQDPCVIARAPGADVCLYDKEFSRNGFSLHVTNSCGVMMCSVKNLSGSQTIELKAQNKERIQLNFNDSTEIESNMKLSVAILTVIIELETGDLDSAHYEVAMYGKRTEEFNIRLQNINTLNNTSLYGNGHTQLKHVNSEPTQNNLNHTPQALRQAFHPNICPSMASSQRPDERCRSCSMTTPKVPVCQLPTCRDCQGFSRTLSCPQSYSMNNYQNIVASSSQNNGYSSTAYPAVPEPSGQFNNWHLHAQDAPLPVAPPCGSNYVNTHPYTENTPHEFNCYNPDLFHKSFS